MQASERKQSYQVTYFILKVRMSLVQQQQQQHELLTTTSLVFPIKMDDIQDSSQELLSLFKDDVNKDILTNNDALS